MLVPLLLVGSLLAGEPGASPAGSEALKTEALKTEVRRLLRDLNEDTHELRAQAEEGLFKLGPPVLEFLPEPDPQASDNVAVAVRRIRKKLQERQALQSIEASTVTLQGRMKISKILAEIQRQTGNKIADLPRSAGAAIPDPEIAVHFDKTPFWAALDSALDEAQLSIYPYGQPNALQIVPRGPNNLPRTGRAVLAGPLRIEPIEVIAKRELRSSSAPGLQVSLEVAWEPRLQPVAIQQRMADVKAVDSKGDRLAPENSLEKVEPFVHAGSSAVQLDLALAMPAQPIKEIASLEGDLRAMMLGRVETFRFSNLLKGKQEKRIAAATVAVDEVRKNGNSWEVFVRLRFDDAGDALESHRNWVLQNEAYLEDASGKRIQPGSAETTLRTANEIGLSYAFALADFPQNLDFVYKSAGIIVTKNLPYTVRGIKMP
jgi:hypothetical protein